MHAASLSSQREVIHNIFIFALNYLYGKENVRPIAIRIAGTVGVLLFNCRHRIDQSSVAVGGVSRAVERILFFFYLACESFEEEEQATERERDRDRIKRAQAKFLVGLPGSPQSQATTVHFPRVLGTLAAISSTFLFTHTHTHIQLSLA